MSNNPVKEKERKKKQKKNQRKKKKKCFIVCRYAKVHYCRNMESESAGKLQSLLVVFMSSKFKASISEFHSALTIIEFLHVTCEMCK